MFQFFGQITPPPGIAQYGSLQVGFTDFLSSLIKLLVVVAGLYTLFNIIFAGYQFISAGGNPKTVTQAWDKIWQSILGLVIIAAALLIAAIIGWLVFQNPRYILAPRIYGPQ